MRVDLSHKTIAVIGGTGFVGRAVVEQLATGARILVLARNSERKTAESLRCGWPDKRGCRQCPEG